MNYEELLNKYLDHELSSDELEEFNTLYSSDASFKQMVDDHKDIIKGIRLAGMSKIRNEVNRIHDAIMPEIIANLTFENDLSKALKLKQHEEIKNEILNVKQTIMESPKNTAKDPKVKPLNFSSVWARAAAVLILISLGIYLFRRNDPVNQEALAKAYDLIKLGSQSAGIADPRQGIYLHQQQVFELVDRNKMDSAMILHDAYYTSQAKTADYFVINGLIYFKAGKNALAKKAFNEGIKHGDQCLSQLLLALMNDKGIAESNKIILKIRENVICQNSPLVNSILNDIK